MFRVVSLAISGANIALNVGAMITDEVLKAKLNSLQDTINGINKKLAEIGIDVQSGVDFFKPIAADMSLVTFSSEKVDTLTNMNIKPLLDSINAEAKILLDDVYKVPDPSVPDTASSTFWTNFVMRGVAIVSITASGAQFIQNMKTYYKDKKTTIAITEENARTSGIETENSETLAGVDEMSVVEGQMDVPTIETSSVPTTPKIMAEGPKLSEKFGAGFDAVMLALTVVSMVLNIINFIKTEKELKEQIDVLTDRLSAANDSVATLSNDQVRFFTDVPSLFLFMQEQINTVAQIATLAETVKTKDDIDDSTANLLALVGSYKPFSDDDFATMADAVAKMDAIQLTYKDDTVEQGIQLNDEFSNLSSIIPNSRFVSAFNGMAATYNNMTLILANIIKSFEFFTDAIKAINVLRSLVKANMDINLIEITMSALLSKPPTETDILVLIAIYTNLDSYKDNDLTLIRAQNKTIDTLAFQQFITNQLTSFYGTLDQGHGLPDSSRSFLISSAETYKIEIIKNGGDLQLSRSAPGSPDYGVVWSAGIKGPANGTLYGLYVMEDGDLQLNQVVHVKVDKKDTIIVVKTWWSSGTKGMGAPPYSLVVLETGVFLLDGGKTILWTQA